MTPIEVASAFYTAFKARDGAQMASLYADDIEFSDPVFPLLRGDHARSMWRMLCGSKDLSVEYRIGSASGNQVGVFWEARYTFGPARRRVHNRVESRLLVESGKVVRHTDHFSFWRWSCQALGLTGLVLGWSPPLRERVRVRAARRLSDFMAHG